MLIKITKRVLFVTWIVVAILILLFAVAINIARIITPALDHKREFFEKWASQALHQPVQIGRVRAWWFGFEPMIRFDEVNILSPKSHRPVIHVRELAIGVDIWDSFWKRKLLPGRVYIDGTHLNVYRGKDGHFRVRGVVSTKKMQPLTTPQAALQMKALTTWLLTQTDIALKDVSLTWHDSNGVVIPIANLNFRSRSQLDGYHVAGRANLAQRIPTRVKFAVNIKAEDILKGPVDANVYINMRHVLLSQWSRISYLKPFLPHVKSLQGQFNSQVWLQWHQNVMESAHGLITAKQVRLVADDGLKGKIPQHLLIDRLHTNILWQRNAQGWSIKANPLQIEAFGKAWPENKLGLQVINLGHSEQQYLMSLNFLRLQDVRVLAERLGHWPYVMRLWYQRLHPQGDLTHIKVQYTTGQPLHNRIVFTSHFNHMGMHPYQQLPSVKNLSGSIVLSPQHSTLELHSQDSIIGLPTMFSHPFYWQKLQATIKWLKNNNGWQVVIPTLQVKNKDVQVNGHLDLQLPPKEKPTMDMQLHFHVPDTKNFGRYVPDKVISAHLFNWLNDAFPHGELNNGQFILKGNMADFPFTDKTKAQGGRFHVQAQLRNVDFRYMRNWPVMLHSNGLISFDGLSMTIRDSQGTIANNLMTNIHAFIPKLTKPNLTVTGQTKSDLANGLGFLTSSPLHVAKELKSMQAKGPMHLKLTLYVPIRGPKTVAQVKGSLYSSDGTLNLPAWKLQLQHLKGPMTFTQNSLRSPGFDAELFGEPVKGSITTVTQKNQPHRIQIHIQGPMDFAKMHYYYPLPFARFLSGKTTYHALLSLFDDKANQPNVLTIQSQLQGVETKALPAPFAKSASASLPLLATLRIYKENKLHLFVHFGHVMQAALLVNQVKKQWSLYSSHIHLGAEKVSLSTLPGLVITGRLARFDWSQWQPILAGFMSGTTKNPSHLGLRLADLHLGVVNVLHHVLHNVALRVQDINRVWHIAVNSSLVAGTALVPQEKGKVWEANLSHLYLPKTKDDSPDQLNHLNFTEVPPLHIRIGHFRYGKTDWGRLWLETRSKTHALDIERLDLYANNMALAASGQWVRTPQYEHAALSGTLTSENLGALLDSQGATKLIGDGKGNASFRFNWPGSLASFDLAKLTGQLQLDFKDGRILKVSEHAEKELGLGRLINIFSLSSFARLGEMHGKGFAFSSFKGLFRFKNGNARTQNTYIDGPVAKVKMTGLLAFKPKNYDLNITVYPKVTSSVPFIVGLAGGPIAGAVTWLVNKVVSPSIGKAASFKYNMQGTWAKPKLALPAPKAT